MDNGKRTTEPMTDDQALAALDEAIRITDRSTDWMDRFKAARAHIDARLRGEAVPLESSNTWLIARLRTLATLMQQLNAKEAAKAATEAISILEGLDSQAERGGRVHIINILDPSAIEAFLDKPGGREALVKLIAGRLGPNGEGLT